MKESIQILVSKFRTVKLKDILFLFCYSCPFLFVYYLNYVLFHTNGTQDTRFLLNFNLYSIILFILYAFKELLTVKDTLTRLSSLTTNKVLSILLFFLSLFTAMGGVFYDTRLEELPIFYFTSLAMTIVAIHSFYRPQSLIISLIFPVLISLIIVNYIIAIFNYPEPDIDIWYIFTLACEYLLNGENPYEPVYPDIYNGLYTPLYGEPRLIYWPLNLILCTIGSLFGDIRYGMFFAILLTIYALFKLSKAYNFSKNNSYLVVIIFLSFSMGLWVLNRSWTEIYMCPFILLSWYYHKKRNFILMGVMIGLTACTKQSIIFYLILLFSTLLLDQKLKDIIKIILCSLGVFVIINLPFILWNPELFYKHTITDLVNYLPRPDSFSWAPYLLRIYGIPFNQSFYGISILSVTLIFALLLLFKKNKKHVFFFTVLVYFFVFITAKQAFCNYYYFLEFLGLMWVLESLRNTHKTELQA